MKKSAFNYRAIALVAAVLLLHAFPAWSQTQPKPDSPKVRMIKDRAGRTVPVSVNVSNAASLLIPSYEKMLLLGQGDKLRLVMNTTNPWAPLIFPEFKKVKKIPVPAALNPNLEDMIADKVDVVFFWNRPEVIAQMAKVKIPVVVTQVTTQDEQSTLEDFLESRRREMLLHGEIFGPEAERRAKEWVNYLEEKVDFIYSRTKSLTDAQRPKVYYVRGPEATVTHGKYSYTYWDIVIAGGRPVVTGQEKDVIERMPAEQLIAQNPDVILMGRVDSTDVILKDPKWAKLNAVKRNKVLVNPRGIFFWDYGVEAPLLMLFIGQYLHPDLFKDVDVAAETKAFYARFFNYKLTDDEVQRILTHRPPA